MRRFLFIGLAAALLPAGSAVLLAAGGGVGQTDPRIGSWTLVSAESALDPANKLSVTDGHGGVHVVMSGETHLDFTAKANGKDSAVVGMPSFNQVELRRVDKKQTEVTEKKDGAVVATIRARLDGRELVVTTSRTGHANELAVWTRIGGAKGVDPLSGDWTEDLSKTRMRQGLTIKFEADGSGGVRFTGDFSYSARFDGKPYDLRGSRNDSVTLALVDMHTVDATYKRDNQVAQKDRWVVSGDGKQMTVTTTGTLETGQRLTEKLVFKRQ